MGADRSARSEPIAGYFERAATGRLPALLFVDLQLQGAKETAGLSNDQHPFSDIRTGDAFMADEVNASMHSPSGGAAHCSWSGTSGGSFDHVRPPRVPDARASSNINDDFGQMGFRTPAVLVSPYAAKGVVNHTQFGHESILKLVEYRFGLRPLTVRDARANNIGTSFAWQAKPRLRPRPSGGARTSCHRPARRRNARHGEARSRSRMQFGELPILSTATGIRRRVSAVRNIQTGPPASPTSCICWGNAIPPAPQGRRCPSQLR